MKGKWLIISRDDTRFCDGVPDCISELDELCPFVTVRLNSKSVQITRKQWEAGGAITEHEVVRKKPRSSADQDSWLIFSTNDCKRCNKIDDCANDIDELDCPAYVSPSFELPVICYLVVLILGVVLHLGWNAVTRIADDEAIELETIGHQLEEAVDVIVEAAIEDRPFPEAIYEIVHERCGGINLLLGTRYGKSVRNSKYRAQNILNQQTIGILYPFLIKPVEDKDSDCANFFCPNMHPFSISY